MNVPSALPVNYSNTAYFYPDETGVLGSFTKAPDAKTLVTLDYTSILTQLNLNMVMVSYILNFGSSPQLIVSGSEFQANNNILSFIVSGGLSGLKYVLQVNVTLSDQETVNTQYLEIVVSGPGIFRGDGCGDAAVFGHGFVGVPGGPPISNVFQQASLLNGDQTRFGSAFTVFWVSNAAPTTANILDRWYNSNDGLIYDRATDGNTVFWVSTAQRPQQYTTGPSSPANPFQGDYWFDTATGLLKVYMNVGAGPQWYSLASSAGTTSGVISTNVLTYGANGIYNPSTGLVYCTAECFGAGGGGGGGGQTVAGEICAGGGGGSGGYSRKTLQASQVSGGVNITIGQGGAGGVAGSGGTSTGAQGGTTSFGPFCVANGGTGAGLQPGPGAGAGTGDVAFAGTTGAFGYFGVQNDPNFTSWTPVGGTVLGGNNAPALVVVANTQANGPSAPANSGAGGYGGCVNQLTAGFPRNAAGGNGGSGFCVVTEFIAT